MRPATSEVIEGPEADSDGAHKEGWLLRRRLKTDPKGLEEK